MKNISTSTVSELIERLQEYPPDTPVLVKVGYDVVRSPSLGKELVYFDSTTNKIRLVSSDFDFDFGKECLIIK